MDSPAALPDTELQALTRQLRRLARGLVDCEADAEDLVQEAWAQALQTPPRDRSRLGNWLAVHLRNGARSRVRAEARRRSRERTVARPEASQAEDRLAASRSLLRELDQLEEPLRSALVLRFLDGLPPREIARRQGVPVETVRSRVRRGLQQLRGRLERSGGAALLPALAFVRPVAVPGGALTLGILMQSKILTGLLALLLVATLWWVAGGDGGVAADAVVPGVEGGGAQVGAAALPSPETESARRPVVPPATASPTDARFRVRFSGRCIDPDSGAPLADVEVSWAPAYVHEAYRQIAPFTGEPVEVEAVRTRSGPRGLFELEGLRTRAWVQALAFEAPGRVRVESLLGPTERVVELGDVPIPDGLAARARVVDTRGRPQSGLRIRLNGPRSSGRPLRLGSQHQIDSVSASDGTLPLPERLGPGEWTLRCFDREIVGEMTWDLGPDATELEIVVAALEGVPSIRGVVVDTTGQPVASAQVEAWEHRSWRQAPASTTAGGAFRVQRWTEDLDQPARLRITCPGFERFETDPLAWGTDDLRVVLRPAGRLDLLVVDAVTERPIEHFGIRDLWRPGESLDPDGSPGVLEHLGHHPGGRLLVPLPSGLHRIFVQALGDGHVLAPPVEVIMETATDTSAVLRLSPTRPRQVRVQDGDGSPVAGSEITVFRAAPRPKQDWLPTTLQWIVNPEDWRAHALPAVWSTDRTDADGLATVLVPVAEPLILRVHGADHLGHEQQVRFEDQPEPLVVTVSRGARVDGRLDPPDFRSRFLRMDPVDPRDDLPGIQLVRGLSTDAPQWFPERAVALDDDGRFTIDHAPPGEWQVVVRGWRAGSPQMKTQVAALLGPTAMLVGGGRQVLPLDGRAILPGTLRARVLINGSPAREERVSIRIDPVAPLVPGHGGPTGFAATTDADGWLELTMLAAELHLAIEGLAAEQALRVVADTATQGAFTITCGTLELRCAGGDAQPVPNALVAVASGGDPPRLLRTDSAGRLHSRLSPGPVRVTALPAALRDRQALDRAKARHGGLAALVTALGVVTAEGIVPEAGLVELRLRIPDSAGY